MFFDYVDDSNVFQTISVVTSVVPIKNGSYYLVKTATTETLVKQSQFVEVRST